MSDAYKTIRCECVAEFKDRGSKFLAILFPMNEEETFQERLAELRAEHFKANHCCSGFRLRSGVERSSDDGEPSGSAGKPIFNQLLSAELLDVGCIVVRYFGGTKLGVSGLINAYKLSTRLAIEEAEVITLYDTRQVEIRFDYAHMGKLMDILKARQIKILDRVMDMNPKLIIDVNASEVESTIKFVKAKLYGRKVEDIKEDDEFQGVSFVLMPDI